MGVCVAVVGSYDNFNALQAQKYYEWAVSDPRIIGALTHNPALPGFCCCQRALLPTLAVVWQAS